MSDMVRCGLIQCANPINDESRRGRDCGSGFSPTYRTLSKRVNRVCKSCVSRDFQPLLLSSRMLGGTRLRKRYPVPPRTDWPSMPKNTTWSLWSQSTKRRCGVCTTTRRPSSMRMVRTLANTANSTSPKLLDFGRDSFSGQVTAGIPYLKHGMRPSVCTFATIGTSRKARAVWDSMAPNCVQSVGHRGGSQPYLWKIEQPAHAVANGYYVGAINRVGTEAPWNIGSFMAPAILSIRAVSLWRKAPKTKVNWWWPISISA